MIGHGAQTSVLSGANANPITVPLTPATDPTGVLVMIAHGEVDTDLVTSVSYGGAALTRKVTVADTTGTEVYHKGRVYIYAKEGGVPSGPVTVTVNRTGTAIVWVAVWTQTGNAAMEVLSTASIAMASTPTVPVMARSGRSGLAYLVVWGGAAGPSNITTPPNMSRGPERDFGEHSAAVFREISPSTANVGYTPDMGSASNAVAGIVVTEVVVVTIPTTGVDFVCGAECGITQPDTSVSALGHYHVSGQRAPTLNTNISRNAGRAYLFAPVAQTSYLGRMLPAAQTTRWARFYVYYDSSLPTGSCSQFRCVLADGTAPAFFYDPATASVKVGFGTGTAANSPGKTIVANRWYRIEVLLNVGANPQTAQLRVCEGSQADPQADGASVLIGTGSSPVAAGTITEWRMGGACGAAATGRVVIDDFLTGTGTSGFPFGPSTIVRPRRLVTAPTTSMPRPTSLTKQERSRPA